MTNAVETKKTTAHCYIKRSFFKEVVDEVDGKSIVIVKLIWFAAA